MLPEFFWRHPSVLLPALRSSTKEKASLLTASPIASLLFQS
jgi:hypothetical protein